MTSNHARALLAAAILACIAGSTHAASAAPAKRCRVSRTFDEMGYHIKMRVSNEGGTCIADLSYTANSTRGGAQRMMPTSGSITTAPQHGTATQVYEPLAARLEYTPTAGFRGTDHLEMRNLPNSRNWLVEVTITP